MSIKKKYLACAFFCVVITVYLAVTTIIFPSAKDYRELILQAKKIDFLYAPAPNYTKTHTMLTIVQNKVISEELASSIKYRGVWFPFTELSGNVYKLKLTLQDGTEHIIDILGTNKIKYNNWCVTIHSDTVPLIKKLVMNNDGELPNKDILLKLLNGTLSDLF